MSDLEISKEGHDTPENTKNKTGMIYISRIPPGMTPSKVRAIMAQHGELGRIYLAPAGGFGLKALSTAHTYVSQFTPKEPAL